VAGAFAASVKQFVQHGRVSSKYFGERHSWPSLVKLPSVVKLLPRASSLRSSHDLLEVRLLSACA